MVSIDEIEDGVAQGDITAMQCFTMMRQKLAYSEIIQIIKGALEKDERKVRAYAQLLADNIDNKYLKKAIYNALNGIESPKIVLHKQPTTAANKGGDDG